MNCVNTDKNKQTNKNQEYAKDNKVLRRLCGLPQIDAVGVKFA